VPAQPGVEVPLLELLADVVDGDVLRAVRPLDLVGDDNCSRVLVCEYAEFRDLVLMCVVHNIKQAVKQ